MLKFHSLLFIYIVTLLLAWSLFSDLFTLFFISLFLSLSFLIITSWGVSNIHSQMFITSINSINGSRGEIALTFDDGPDENNTPKLLKVLKKHEVKATFFLIGEKIVANKGIVEMIIKDGHQICNHTYYHKYCFPFYSKKKMRNEILMTQEET